MEPIQRRAIGTHIVVVGLCMFAILVITVSLGGGCRRQEPSPKAQTTSPSPTPNPAETPEGDTPIVVKGGGSINLEFADTVFTGTPPSCTNCSVTSVTLQQIKKTGDPIDPAVDPVQCRLPSNPEITIETKNNSDNITVKGTANTVQINFPAAKYPGVITACGDEEKRHSKDGEIKKVKVNGTECGGCSNMKRCKVVISVNN